MNNHNTDRAETATDTPSKKPTGFDPAAFAEATIDTVEMEILHPVTHDPTGWKITFAGPAHPQHQAMIAKIQRKALQDQRQREAARVNGKKFKPEEKSTDQAKRESLQLIVDQTVTWEGSTVEYDPKAWLDMLLDPKNYVLLEQVTEFLDNDKLFTKGSATT